jgi:ribonuclease I
MQRRDGSWPASCSTEPLDKRVVDKLAKDLDYYWPNIKDLPDDPDYSDFWSHEWGKHGTCSGLSQLDYFQTALEHQIATPPLVQQAYGKTISKTDLLEAYNNKVVPVCSHRRYLQEVRACYAMDVDGRPTARVECPAPVQKEGNCGDEITLSKFPAMQAQRPTQAGDSSLRKEGARVS